MVQEAQTVVTIEDLNPKGAPVRELRMACKRGLALRALLNDMSKEYLLEEFKFAPHGVPTVGGRSVSTRLREIYGDGWYNHPEILAWNTTFEMWHSGSLDRQIRDMAQNLPEDIRSKMEI